ncbi:hypothetical protein KUTeg_000732 [Tegillarca granosa]|uniref:G-protein coupled receptors family 1 profile domain-containing protein n=1 Tax=Tegillarca granosa TaxID=220873 RepID=A0ABQ9FZQ1_TEGGR|nr:hypothetical protein KUTeg_000732 [Tegillarca granosa]
MYLNTNSSDPRDFSNEVSKTLAPVIAIVCIYSILGILGNPFVVIFYGCKLKPTPSFTFIVCLAVFDLIVCCISIPMEIVDMVEFYSFPNDFACKFLRFINYFASMTSGLFLLAIAADRFRKICKPLQKQVTNKMAKVIVAVVIITGLFLSWPSLVFYHVTEVNITVADGVIGHDCTAMQDENYTMYVTIYHGLLFLVFIISTISLSVIYLLVVRQLMKTQKRFREHQETEDHPTLTPSSKHPIESSDNKITNDADLEDKYSDMEGNRENKIQNKNGRNLENTTHSETTVESEINSSEAPYNSRKSKKKTFREEKEKHSKSYRQRKKEAFNLHTRKYTFISLAITIGFIVSFLPYLIIFLYITLTDLDVVAELSTAGLVLIEFGVRSWIINSVVNPFIYGFFNDKFRLFVHDSVKAVFCCLCCRKSPALKYGVNDQTWMSYSASGKSIHHS